MFTVNNISGSFILAKDSEQISLPTFKFARNSLGVASFHGGAWVWPHFMNACKDTATCGAHMGRVCNQCVWCSQSIKLCWV